MITQKFLEEFGLIEDKIRQKVGSDSKSQSLGSLLQQLKEKNLADNQLFGDLNELRLYRNKLTSAQISEVEVPNNIVKMLSSAYSALSAS